MSLLAIYCLCLMYFIHRKPKGFCLGISLWVGLISKDNMTTSADEILMVSAERLCEGQSKQTPLKYICPPFQDQQELMIEPVQDDVEIEQVEGQGDVMAVSCLTEDGC